MYRTSVMVAAAAITLSAATAAAQVGSPLSLGEIARQTANKRATSKPATKVYTNASLDAAPAEEPPAAASNPAVPVSAANTSKSGSQAAGAAVAVENIKEQNTPNTVPPDENYWRDAAASARRDLEQAKTALDSQEKAQPARAEAARHQYEQAQRMVAYFQKRWDALVESAKAANVPPAWLEPRK